MTEQKEKSNVDQMIHLCFIPTHNPIWSSPSCSCPLFWHIQCTLCFCYSLLPFSPTRGAVVLKSPSNEPIQTGANQTLWSIEYYNRRKDERRKRWRRRRRWKGFPSLPSIISIIFIYHLNHLWWGMKLQIRKLNYPPDIDRGESRNGNKLGVWDRGSNSHKT